MLAAKNVALALAREACAALGVVHALPRIEAVGDSGLRVIVDRASAGAQAEALRDRLTQTMGALPLKVEVALA